MKIVWYFCKYHFYLVSKQNWSHLRFMFFLTIYSLNNKWPLLRCNSTENMKIHFSGYRNNFALYSDWILNNSFSKPSITRYLEGIAMCMRNLHSANWHWYRNFLISLYRTCLRLASKDRRIDNQHSTNNVVIENSVSFCSKVIILPFRYSLYW